MRRTFQDLMTSTTTFRSEVLHTKDGSKVGNGIRYGTELSRYVEGTVLNLVETDFGNRMKLTNRELEELYTVGPERDYDQWKKDREEVQLNHRIEDQTNAYEATRPTEESDEHKTLWNKTDGCCGIVNSAPGGGVKCDKCAGWFCY